MKAKDVIQHILHGKNIFPSQKQGNAFAPANIALIKYWGKRNQELNLPLTDSFSITLPEKGAFTECSLAKESKDRIYLNDILLSPRNNFYQRLSKFLDNFRSGSQIGFNIRTTTNVPINAGLASSSCGFAALILSLNNLFDWQLTAQELSIVARLGSGSACRSLWPGFVHWFRGKDPNGMDCYAEPIHERWEDLHIGLLTLSHQEKKISSRNAMLQTQATSTLYSYWSDHNNDEIKNLAVTIKEKNFTQFGKLVETNALGMHATALTSWPPIQYATSKTLIAMQKIWQARKKGLLVFFTQDAGPNLKLLFLKKDTSDVQNLFPAMEIMTPFPSETQSNHVILVDNNDRAVGSAEKVRAHQQALCHRAFSIFIFRKNSEDRLELLLQQRNFQKLHCGGLWTNTCCSHPKPGESLFSAAKRRLMEELGMKVEISPRGVFHYIAPFDNNITENEVDHVLIGFDDGTNIQPNLAEVQDIMWKEVNWIQEDLKINPVRYTPWFSAGLRIALSDRYINQLDVIMHIAHDRK